MTIAETEIEAPVQTAPTPLAERPFDPAGVVTMAGGHFVHDVFGSFLSPLLPLLIPKLGLSLTLAGSLAALQSFPSLINPFAGDGGRPRQLALAGDHRPPRRRR